MHPFRRSGLCHPTDVSVSRSCAFHPAQTFCIVLTDRKVLPSGAGCGSRGRQVSGQAGCPEEKDAALQAGPRHSGDLIWVLLCIKLWKLLVICG